MIDIIGAEGRAVAQDFDGLFVVRYQDGWIYLYVRYNTRSEEKYECVIDA